METEWENERIGDDTMKANELVNGGMNELKKRRVNELVECANK